ncbi:efflux transporter outer membrane subunit [Rubritalea tangerina]|uniref:Efflux transporter outer membrane subunit n=1 Tax=Rubritalea tangerina TaxID=430798 RepID=A0ABW4Z7D6_9BACT
MRKSLVQGIWLSSGVAATLPLGMVSCMVGPEYVEPVAPIQQSWDLKDPSLVRGSKSKVDLEWWKQFNDVQLNQLVESAYSENLTLRTAALRILESRAILGIAHGNLYPQGQALSGDVLALRAPGGAGQDLVSTSFGFDAAWELDFWGKFRKSIDSADASLLADVADFDDILTSLTAEVATTYVNVRTIEERIELARKNAELQEESLKIVELQFEAGTVTELDVLQAKTLLTNTQSQIPRFQATLYKLHNALSVLLAKDADSIRQMLRGGKGIPQAPIKVAVGVPAELLRRRPDIRRAEMLAVAQSAQIGIAKADLYPSFTLVGFLGTSATDLAGASLGDAFDSDNVGYTFGPTFRWNILNYGRIKNSVRVQDARFEQTITAYQNTVLNAAREVEDGMTGFVHTKKEAEFLRLGVESSKRSTEISMIQYKDGLTDYQRVLDSIRSLTQRQDQYASVKGTIATDFIAMYKALGGGWEMRDREDALPPEIREKMKQRTDWGRFLDLPEPIQVSEATSKG